MPSSFDPPSEVAGGARVTVVIPNWNGMYWLPRCLLALQRQTTSRFVTLIVDNGSTDGSVEYLRREYPAVDLVRLPTNTGFAHAVNVGIDRSTTSYIALLNTDTEADPDWLCSLVETLDRAEPDIAAVTSHMLRLDQPDLTDNAGDELSWYGAASKRGHGQSATNFASAAEVFSPCAGATLYRRDFLRAMGGFDESFFAYLEDVDLGLRGRLRGYRYLYQPRAKVLHAGHGAGIREDRYVELMTKNRLLLFVKNIPLALLLRHAAKPLYGQVYFIAAYGRPWASIKGYAGFIRDLPQVLRHRRHNLRSTLLNYDEIAALLSSEMPRIPWQALRKRLGAALPTRNLGVLS